MYLSRLILDPRSRQVRNELADPYEMHRTVCRAFPHADYKDNQPSGILFRVDLHPRTQIPTLLVQSSQAPDWTFLLSEKKGYLLGDADLPLDVENPSYRELDLRLQEGQMLAFRLRANPTKRIKDTAKRVGLVREEDQRAWLERKLAAAGAMLISVNIASERAIHGKLFKENEPKKRMSFFCTRFDGVLQVKDPLQLVGSIQTGFGSAKGLGFGLLSLARPQ